MNEKNIKFIGLLAVFISFSLVSVWSYAGGEEEDQVEIIPPEPPVVEEVLFCENLDLNAVQGLIEKIKFLQKFIQSRNEQVLIDLELEVQELLVNTENLTLLSQQSYEESSLLFNDFLQSAENLKAWVIQNIRTEDTAFYRIKTLWPIMESLSSLCGFALSPWQEAPQRTPVPQQQPVEQIQMPQQAQPQQQACPVYIQPQPYYYYYYYYYNNSGGSCYPSGNYPSGNFPSGNFPSGNFPSGNFPPVATPYGRY